MRSAICKHCGGCIAHLILIACAIGGAKEQTYYTTPSATIVLSTSTMGVNLVDFKQYTISGVILPYVSPTSVFSTVSQLKTGLYPNPASGTLFIQSEEPMQGTGSITLTDVTGRVVLSAAIVMNNQGTATADISGVSPGIYLLRVTSDHITYTGKLMVQE